VPLLYGFDWPVLVTNAGDGSNRLFVVEKPGRIVIVRDGSKETTPFLDIQPLVGSDGSEQGLLGLAFHPDYSSNGEFFVNYTNLERDTVIARYQVTTDSEQADPSSATMLLQVDQPASNHNGGNLVFGPDGFLYIGLGDGGRTGDPWGNAQNLGVLLGKLLRIDVDGGSPYGIPADNPFMHSVDPGVRPEIWAYGLRNPWRYSFDRATGDLYIGDVGQYRYEWVHRQPAGTGGGQNYGWNIREGSHCYSTGTNCDTTSLVSPIAEYDHSLGCSITGGYAYRGAAYPELVGTYFFADYCSGRFWSLRETTPGDWLMDPPLESPLRPSSFGEDEDGELYVVSLHNNGLYRLVASF
jgi:glucose/arabinose dehydrogenase